MSKSRAESCPAVKKLQFAFGDYKVRYAWVSQRGFYPDDLTKANQDSHVEVASFAACARTFSAPPSAANRHSVSDLAILLLHLTPIPGLIALFQPILF